MSSSPELTVHGVLGWRSDSMILRRLRPVLTDLLADAATNPCQFPEDVGECRVVTTERGEWCPACLLTDLASRVQRAVDAERTQQREERDE